MRDISLAYNFGGSQYKNILGISDPYFSGGDSFVAYADYLNERAQRNKGSVDDVPVIEAKVQNGFAGGNGVVKDKLNMSLMGKTTLGKIADIGKGIYVADRFGRYQTISTNSGPTVFGIMDMTKGRIRNGKPAGMWALRVDKPHGDFGPHINKNPQYYKKSDPHLSISDDALKLAANADTALSYAKIGGKAMTAFGVALDANELYNAYRIDGNSFGNTSATTAGGIAFSWAGAFAGAKVGAIGGAAIGGVVGGLIGGFIGGIAGGLIGRSVGEFAGDYLYDGKAEYHGQVYGEG